MSQLFSPLSLGGLALSNRIAVSPMCQFSAENGNFSLWHTQHLSSLAMSGAALVMIEATNVSADGRITEGCTGLWSDENGRSLETVLTQARKAGGTAAFGIQIGHAGRKGPTQIPWHGGKPLTPEQAWTAMAPSPIALADGWPTPKEMTGEDITKFKNDCVAATRRALAAGVQVIELHAAHGYLLHQFLSPLTNRRTDQYGGSLANRMRLPLEVAAALRGIVPRTHALGARITATDWLPDGINEQECVALASELQALGADYVCVTSGGLILTAPIKIGPGYQIAFAAAVKAALPKLVVRCVGLIAEPSQAEQVIVAGQADQIAMARAFLDDPRWGWHAAEKLGVKLDLPPQYARAHHSLWPGAKLVRP